MKKIYGFVTALLLFSFAMNLNAQSPCSNVTAITFSNVSHYYGIRVSISQTYSEDITVTGYIYDDFSGANFDNPFTLTITAGNLLAETSASFFQSNEYATTATVIVDNVNPCPFFGLSEEESQTIVESSPFQNFIRLRDNFLDKIDSAVNQASIPLDSIKAAVLDAINNNNYQSFYSKLFSSTQTGEALIDSIVAARDSFLAECPFAEEYPGQFTCDNCGSSISDKINYFFDNFSAIDEYRYTDETEEVAFSETPHLNNSSFVQGSNNLNYEMSFNQSPVAEINYTRVPWQILENTFPKDQLSNGNSKTVVVPTCGSWWNQIKLAICATACSITTVGLATPFCGWGCWCTFCSHHSALAHVLCDTE